MEGKPRNEYLATSNSTKSAGDVIDEKFPKENTSIQEYNNSTMNITAGQLLVRFPGISADICSGKIEDWADRTHGVDECDGNWHGRDVTVRIAADSNGKHWAPKALRERSEIKVSNRTSITNAWKISNTEDNKYHLFVFGYEDPNSVKAYYITVKSEGYVVLRAGDKPPKISTDGRDSRVMALYYSKLRGGNLIKSFKFEDLFIGVKGNSVLEAKLEDERTATLWSVDIINN